MVMQPFWNEAQLTGILKYVLKAHRQLVATDGCLMIHSFILILLLDPFTVHMSCGSVSMVATSSRNCSKCLQKLWELKTSGGIRWKPGRLVHDSQSIIYLPGHADVLGGRTRWRNREWWKKRRGGVRKRWGHWKRESERRQRSCRTCQLDLWKLLIILNNYKDCIWLDKSEINDLVLWIPLWIIFAFLCF